MGVVDLPVPLSTGLIILIQRQNSATEICTLTLQEINALYVLWYWTDNTSYSEGKMPNFQCQKDPPGHNCLLSVTVSGTKGTGNFWGLPCTSSFNVLQAVTCCLFLGDQPIVSSTWDLQLPPVTLIWRQSWPASYTQVWEAPTPNKIISLRPLL